MLGTRWCHSSFWLLLSFSPLQLCLSPPADPPSCPQSRVSIRACERSRWRHTARNSPMGLTALSGPLLPLLVLVLAHASLSDRLVIELQTKVHEVFTITGMAPTTAVSWLKVLTSTFTLKTVKSQVLAGAGDYFRPSKPHSGTLWEILCLTGNYHLNMVNRHDIGTLMQRW